MGSTIETLTARAKPEPICSSDCPENWSCPSNGAREIHPLPGGRKSGRPEIQTSLRDPQSGKIVAFDPKKHAGLQPFEAEVLIVANFDRNAHRDYGRMDVIPDGQWKEVFNSDAEAYGGTNVGNAGGTFDGWDRGTKLNLPPGGFVALLRIG